MTGEIALVWNRPNDRLWLIRLREWTAANGQFLNRLGIKALVQAFNSPNDALSWRAELPNERLVVTTGFSRGEIEASQKSNISGGEPIIVRDPNAARPDTNASASFLSTETMVSCLDVEPQIRKSLIRVALRSRIEIRQPRTDAELMAYFALRYKIWESVGYLRVANKQSRTK
jgi:hypothetical protein